MAFSKTTLLGIIAGALTYLTQVGLSVPTNRHEAGATLMAAILAALGYTAKDADGK